MLNIQQRIWAQNAALFESKKVEDETVEEAKDKKVDDETVEENKDKKAKDETVEEGKTKKEELSPEQTAFRKLFDKMLDKYGIDSPNDLDDSKKDDFFNEIEKEWKKDPANDKEGEGE
jgi:hypothetical protein